MIKYSELTEKVYQNLEEALVIVGRKPYPKFGHVVIMAGGAGSGKGFVKDKLIPIDGYNFDVDELKKMVAKSPKIREKVKRETGEDLEVLSKNLKNPENVSKLHHIVSTELAIDERKKEAFMTSVMAAHPDRKPNIIFDVTLSTLTKLNTLTQQVKAIGYKPENIHIVWIINDIHVAKQQNQSRDRVVPEEILVNTHKGVSATMQDVLNMGKGLTKYMDGDIVFAFNKVYVDSDVTMSGNKTNSPVIASKAKSKGLYIKRANYFYVKKAGKPVLTVSALDKSIREKIRSYVPKSMNW